MLLYYSVLCILCTSKCINFAFVSCFGGKSCLFIIARVRDFQCLESLRVIVESCTRIFCLIIVASKEILNVDLCAK